MTSTRVPELIRCADAIVEQPMTLERVPELIRCADAIDFQSMTSQCVPELIRCADAIAAYVFPFVTSVTAISFVVADLTRVDTGRILRDVITLVRVDWTHPR